MSNVKNYMEQGGERWIIGGTLEMSDGTHIKLGAQTLKTILDGKLSATAATAQADSTGVGCRGVGGGFQRFACKDDRRRPDGIRVKEVSAFDRNT